MSEYFIISVPVKNFRYSADMLRFDSAYKVSRKGDNYEIESLHFTPARWASFNQHSCQVRIKMTEREWKEKSLQAEGFIAGIRFAQDLLESEKESPTQITRLVEGDITVNV